jgi:Skp family chaperone for outer membrane proteins
MKRFTLFVALLILASIVVQAQAPAATPAAAAAQAQAKPATPGNGIGVIIFGTAVLESDPGKAAVEKINKAMEPAKVAFEKAAKEAEAIQEKLKAAKTDAERAPLNRELESKARAVKLLQEDAQVLSEDLQEQYFEPIGLLVRKIVEEYARDSNLAIVMDPSTEPSNIIFANKLNEITSEITRRVNAAYAKDPKIVAPTTPAPAPAAPPAKTP